MMLLEKNRPLDSYLHPCLHRRQSRVSWMGQARAVVDCSVDPWDALADAMRLLEKELRQVERAFSGALDEPRLSVRLFDRLWANADLGSERG